jgi:hypothetical protein
MSSEKRVFSGGVGGFVPGAVKSIAATGGVSGARFTTGQGAGSNAPRSAPPYNVREMLGNGIGYRLSNDGRVATLNMYIGYKDHAWVEYDRDQISTLISKLQAVRDAMV